MLTEDQAFSLLKRRILIDRGLDCQQYKENYLKRRLGVRMRATDSESYLEYLGVLRETPAEYTFLLNELTINVTQFFRDKDVYLKIRDEVIPELLRDKKAAGRLSLRIWSAGCASGEEPYSLAIITAFRLGRALKEWKVSIIGSDIDEKSLRLARRATYEASDILRGMNPGMYFHTERTEDGEVYTVREEIKQLVRFEKANLLEENRRRHFDIICCRNVLIYFSRDVQARIVNCLASSLAKDGYLALGKSEVISKDAEQRFESVFPRERIFKLAENRHGATRAGGH